MNQDFGDFEDDLMFDNTCRCGHRSGGILCDDRGCRCTTCGGFPPPSEDWDQIGRTWSAPGVTELPEQDARVIRQWIAEDEKKERADAVDRAQRSASD